MVFKPTYVHRKRCLPLYILCVELSRFRSRRLWSVYQNKCSPSYIKLETEVNLQNVVTFVLIKLDTKFKVLNSEKQRLLLHIYF